MGISVADLFASIEQSPIATVVTDPHLPDNPIVAANAAFLELTGYAAGEVIGRNCRMLAGPGTSPEARARLKNAIEASEPVLVELQNYRRDGSSFANAVMIAPLRDDDGSVAFLVGSQMNLGEGAPSAEARRSVARDQVARLTERQRQVLEGVVRGRRNKQIAQELGIGEKTVKMHRAALLERLGVATSAQAIRIGLEAGLV